MGVGNGLRQVITSVSLESQYALTLLEKLSRSRSKLLHITRVSLCSNCATSISTIQLQMETRALTSTYSNVPILPLTVFRTIREVIVNPLMKATVAIGTSRRLAKRS